MKNWYIIKVHSGQEKKVQSEILQSAQKAGLSDCFEQISVPSTKVSEIRRGKKIETEKKLMPGYVLLRMEMNDKTLSLIHNIQGIAFLGSKKHPLSLSDKEVDVFFNKLDAESKQTSSAGLYEIGQVINVTDDVNGVIEEIDYEKQKLKVSVFFFGKPTPIELSFSQVKKE